MARRAAPGTSGATVARVRRSRSKSANQATRALLASMDALAAKVALQAADRNDTTRWALRYLEACRPTSVLATAPLSAEDKTKMAYAQADQMVGVLRAVLEGLMNRPGLDGGSTSWRKMESCQTTPAATTARSAIQPS